MNFLRYICAYFQPNNLMSNTLQDLNNSLTAAVTASQDNQVAVQAVTDAINLAAQRASSIPGPVDYTTQVQIVDSISSQLVAATNQLNQDKITADGILP